MPKRFITYSRLEPARTILFAVANLTWVMQLLFLALHWTVAAIPNLALVLVICLYAVWASHTHNIRHMAPSAFWVFCAWLWSALTRALFSPDWAMLLWFPMLIVAVAMAVVYINLSFQKRQGH